MIQMREINKTFEKHPAINDVNLTIEKGSIYGLIGSNGAGKTTVIKLLAGIYKQDSGEVLLNGTSIYENEQLKAKLFYISDQPYFFPQYTVKQMAQFYKSIYPSWNESRFIKLAEVFEFSMNKKIQTFSKGVQRQAAFWLALSAMPEILILDEPMDGLDPVARKKVKNLLIQDVADREMTILISSHNLREIEDICDHIGILHNGALLLEKDLDDLKSDIHKVQVAYKGDPPAYLEDNLKVLHCEKRGSVMLCIIRGKEEEIEEKIRKSQPVIFDLLPLTLEEIFIYEMGDIGYAIKNVIV
ncbi:ABC transporter ATP-binding protein [Mesobacillus subterraneus]|uniref:ABC transporter ATP-binding protein n=1 Tax=Mesobacillus subterraneus TaxID=285983 RepID=UPI00203D2847|nr:ABC transporter ATP-binding protein [Mesobacillus subterraneus]MCM3664911.1 ABC transporter ATP-binding protein [Mesobacillus subterraneus]MCM3681999.1 ABC transporter ATP-binding protein [Mesobacillus subterraneus]